MTLTVIIPADAATAARLRAIAAQLVLTHDKAATR